MTTIKLLNFGPLENDPDFDVIAVVQENTAKLYKKAIQPPMPPHQGSLPENKDDTGRPTL